jgi:two-component system, OmpR family, response regulator CpxR
MSYQLLLVDDDIELCDLLSEYLQQEGFRIDSVHSGSDAAQQLKQKDYDLMVLDVMLPNMNGFDVLRQVRERNPLPILMLTARGDDIDRVVGLEMGADDYLTKPCNPRELVARIRSILRRFEMVPQSKKGESYQEIQLLDVSIKLSSREVFVANNIIDLTGTEFEILALLLKNHGQLVTRETISEQCLGRKLVAYDRSIDMHVSNIRRKLAEHSRSLEHIKTIRGTGYQYVAI